MPERLQAFLKQLAAFWQGLSTPKRIALVGLTTAVLAGVLYMTTIGSEERYAPLYTELSTEDAAGIVEKLKTMQVPHKLDNNGSMILVPETRVPALRL